jgi:hypothetical protein
MSKGPTENRGPSREAGTPGRRDAGTQGRRDASSLCSTCQEVKRETQERVLMLRPVRPCVPVSAGMGCARSPLQAADRAGLSSVARQNASTRDCPACCCACRRRTAPSPRHCWRLPTALPFVVRGDITHQVVDELQVGRAEPARLGKLSFTAVVDGLLRRSRARRPGPHWHPARRRPRWRRQCALRGIDTPGSQHLHQRSGSPLPSHCPRRRPLLREDLADRPSSPSDWARSCP